jgi:cytochrome P450
LAELQLRISREEILRQFQMIEVVGEAKHTSSNSIHGFRSMPVRSPG